MAATGLARGLADTVVPGGVPEELRGHGRSYGEHATPEARPCGAHASAGNVRNGNEWRRANPPPGLPRGQGGGEARAEVGDGCRALARTSL